MPSRIVQTLCSALFVIIFLLLDKSTLASLWIIFPTGILVAASFSMGSLINEYWFAKYPPKLNTYELNWLRQFVPYYNLMNTQDKEVFANKLALELNEKEFISMAEKEIPEELKMMALTPAIKLNLIHSNLKAENYSRIIFYHHAFASPDQQYLHLSETQHEDGALVFASDALEAAYLKPNNFFNTALYEWCSIFIDIHKVASSYQIDSNEAWTIINTILSTEKNVLLKYLGQPTADHLALLCYCYVMFPQELKNNLPEYYQLLDQKLV